MGYSQLCGISMPKLWVRLQYQYLTALTMRLRHLSKIFYHQEKTGFSSLLLEAAYSDTPSGYNYFISLSFTQEVSTYLLWQHRSQPIEFYKTFGRKGCQCTHRIYLSPDRWCNGKRSGQVFGTQMHLHRTASKGFLLCNWRLIIQRCHQADQLRISSTV